MIATIFIIYVSDQEAAKVFYQSILGIAPHLHVPGMTEFTLSEHSRLGIMPEKGIEKIICPALPSPTTAGNAPRCELYFYVDHPEAYHAKALENGATDILRAQDMDWGDKVAYVADPFGHVVAFARKLLSP